MKKKILACILVLALVIGLLPSNMQQVEAAYTNATLTVCTVTPQDGANRYLVYLDVADFDENTLDVNAIWGNNTVYIDGKPVSSSNSVADVNYAVDSNQLLLTLDYSVFGATASANVGKHTVIIPAGTVIGGTLKTTNEVGVIINNDTISVADVITFTEVNYVAQDDRYLFTYDVTGTTVTDRFWNNNTVYLDGNAVFTDANGAQSVNYAPGNGNQLLFLLDYSWVEAGKTSAESLEEIHTLTILGGTAVGNCILKNTFNYTLDKSTITSAEPTADVTVTPNNPHNAGATGFQFTVENPTDSLAYDGGWTINYYFTNGGVTYQKSTDIEAQELSNVFLKKIGAGTYFLVFDHYVANEGLAFANGDKVTINGLVQSIGYGVQFAETTFVYDGSAWAVYEETEPSLTFVNTNGGAWQGTRWLTYLTSTEEVPAEGTFVQSGVTIGVSDGENETFYTLNAGDLLVVEGKWALLLVKESYPAMPTQEEIEGKACIVTIKAGTVAVSDGTILKIPNDVKILYADSSVKGVIADAESKIVATNNGSAGGVYFGTETDNGWEYDGATWSTRPNIEYGTVTLDETVLTPTVSSLVKFGATGYYFSLNPVETSGIPSSLGVGSVITFDFYASETAGNGKVVYFPETSLQLTETGWETYIPPTSSSLTFTNTSGGAWQETRWLTYLTSTEKVPTEGTAIQSGLSIAVSDGATETTYTLNAGDLIVVEGKWALLLWNASYPVVPTQEETSGKYYIVTLKAGTGVDNNGASWVISEDVSILYCDGAVQGVIAKETTKMITVTGENLGNTGGIYFSTETTNELSYSEDWGKRPYIECGKITLDGVSLTTTAGSLVKLLENRYFFSFNPRETGNIPDTLGTNSILTMDFYASETQDCGKVIYFPKTTFVLTDAGWIREVVLGDANDNQGISATDIVRLKTYLNNSATAISVDGADANESGKVDERDIQTLYEYLLEGVRFTKDGENSQAVTGIPYYADDIEISLGAYHGPRAAGMTDYNYTSGGTISGTVNNTSYLNSTEFLRYANAGLNTLIHEADAVYASSTAKIGIGVNNSDFKEYMRLAYEQGLDVYVTSQGLNSYLKPEGYGSTPVGIDFNDDGNFKDDGVTDTATVDETAYGWDYNGNGTLETSVTLPELFYYTDNITDGNGKTILEADIEELLDFIVEQGYDNFKGFVMADETYANCITQYQNAVAMIQREGEERGLDLTVLGSQLPSQAEGVKNSDGNYYISSGQYTNYVSSMGVAAGTFTFDRYPLLKEKSLNGWLTKKVLDSGWLTNLKTVAEQGKTNGFTTGVTIQSSGFEYGTNTGFFGTDTFKRDPESDADIQFQVYTALAYGMKSINYFTYWEHPSQNVEWFTSSMVQYGDNGEGKETAIYNYVKNANEEIKKFDHVFLDYDWIETLDATVNNDTNGTITSWTQTTDVLIGCMYDKKKQLDGYWLINASNPSEKNSKEVAVAFKEATRALVFVDGEQSLITLENGIYQTTLKEGEGQFVIPIQ